MKRRGRGDVDDAAGVGVVLTIPKGWAGDVAVVVSWIRREAQRGPRTYRVHGQRAYRFPWCWRLEPGGGGDERLGEVGDVGLDEAERKAG